MSVLRRNIVSKHSTSVWALIVVAALSGACANTVRGVKQDTEKVAEKTAAGANTVDVKSALIADGRVKGLAVIGDRRWPRKPDMLTLSEQGYAKTGGDSWHGIPMPRCMPASRTSASTR